MEGSAPRWAAVFLAAGYGTRLAADLQSEANKGGPLGGLSHLPKALLPCGNEPLLDHWLHLFRYWSRCAVDTVLVVTNDKFFPALSQRAEQCDIPAENVLSNGTSSNETRLGACADLALLLERRADAISGRALPGSHRISCRKRLAFAQDRELFCQHRILQSGGTSSSTTWTTSAPAARLFLSTQLLERFSTHRRDNLATLSHG